MKARHIKKLRTKINNPNYYYDRLREVADEREELERFWKFECSSFFRGELKAELNQEIYWQKSVRNKAAEKWYKKKLKGKILK